MTPPLLRLRPTSRRLTVQQSNARGEDENETDEGEYDYVPAQHVGEKSDAEGEGLGDLLHRRDEDVVPVFLGFVAGARRVFGLLLLENVLTRIGENLEPLLARPGDDARGVASVHGVAAHLELAAQHLDGGLLLLGRVAFAAALGVRARGGA